MRVKAVAGLWLVRSVDAKAVERAGHQAADMEMPDIAVTVAEVQPRHFLAAIGGEQAQLDPFRMGGKHGEVDALAVKTGTHRPGAARPGAVTRKFCR